MSKIEKKEKTPDDLKTEFSKWKSKKEEKLLKLYQERDKKEEKGEDSSAIKKEIENMNDKIENRRGKLENRLNRLYAKFYKAGASSDAKKARQERTHHLCNLGGLVEKAGLGEMEPVVLLGMLLQQAEYLESNPAISNRWRERGQAALDEKEALEGF